MAIALLVRGQAHIGTDHAAKRAPTQARRSCKRTIRLVFVCQVQEQRIKDEWLQVSEHSYLFTEADFQCPYCGQPVRRHQLGDHFKSGCTQLGICTVPPLFRRRTSTQELDEDPRYPVLQQRHTAAGTIVVRPMSMEQVFEASLVITEAFLVDPDPPEFSWTRTEVLRDVERYSHEPEPVTRSLVDYGTDSQWDVRWDPQRPWGHDRSEAYRICQLQAWGRWVWLAAELLPADRRLPGKLVGTIAVMLHERSTALQRLASMSPEKPDHLLDPPLWVLPQTPQGWPCQRVAFFWWTATHSSFRSPETIAVGRQGLGTMLLRAAEQVAAGAGYLDAYVQVCTKQRAPLSPLGGWRLQPYTAATDLYRRAGYVEWQSDAQQYTQQHVVLMRKRLL